MENLDNISKEIQKIKERNTRVENDKARETSLARKIIIAILTYFVVVIFFYFADISRPRINAIVPTMWFLLSTLSMWIFKKLRLKSRNK